ncbi:MAG TPA: SDR family NAD(P)-dependent oxidoreductase [Candidatus Binataceae bacterium]|nr:SDR family NAD(P)-dependent oxidoreductase [Candidatus Binataceae bacterium]
MTQELAGKVAIITGAGRMRSIGRPIAKILGQSGAAIVITGTGRRPEDYPEDEKAAGWRDIESVADEVRRLGARCLPLISDIRDENAVHHLVERTVKEFGRLDIVINNASAARGPDRVAATELPYEVWRKVITTNLDGTFLLSRAAARQLIAQGEGGSIVNISSIASKLAPPNMAAYASSKAAINALSRSMALELAPHRIRVNAVCPGVIDTFRMDDLGRGERWRNFVKTTIPLGYPGDGSECAEFILFLVSERGKWITGQAINVDGGSAWGN